MPQLSHRVLQRGNAAIHLILFTLVFLLYLSLSTLKLPQSTLQFLNHLLVLRLLTQQILCPIVPPILLGDLKIRLFPFQSISTGDPITISLVLIIVANSIVLQLHRSPALPYSQDSVRGYQGIGLLGHFEEVQGLQVLDVAVVLPYCPDDGDVLGVADGLF